METTTTNGNGIGNTKNVKQQKKCMKIETIENNVGEGKQTYKSDMNGYKDI